MKTAHCSFCNSEHPLPEIPQTSNEYWQFSIIHEKTAAFPYICKERRRKHRASYNQNHPHQNIAAHRRYKRTLNGLLAILYHRCKAKEKQNPAYCVTFSLQEFKDWCHNQPSLIPLYRNWVESRHNPDLKPSIDRMDCFKGYEVDNMRIITWRDNREKQFAYEITQKAQSRKALEKKIKELRGEGK